MNQPGTAFGKVAAFALALSAGAFAGIATPRLHVDGNQIKDTAGNTVVLRGVSMIHAGWPYAYGAGTTKANTTIKNFLKLTDTTGGWFPRVVRVPVADSVGTTYLFPLKGSTDDKDKWVASNLQPLIDSAKARGVYVIIDFHLIEDVTPAKSERCKQFWSYMAPKFANQEHVIYEVFNEPVKTPLDDLDWSSLRDTAQSWVDTIRAYAPKTIVLVGPPNWSSNLDGIVDAPITGGNIVYVAHMYPQNSVASIKSQMVTVMAKYPVFLSEWGFDTSSTANVPTKGTATSYATPLRTWADAKNTLSWTAWCWSGSWGPPMWTDDKDPDALNPFGAFAKTWLNDKRNSDLPSGVFKADTGKADTTKPVVSDSLTFASFDMPFGQNPRQTDLAARIGSTSGGWWYVFHDDSGTTVTNSAGTDVANDTAALGAAVKDGAMHVKMTTSTAKMTYPYAGLEANITTNKAFFDLRKLTKIVLRLKGKVTKGKLRVHFLTRDVLLAKDWGNYGMDISLDTAWKDIEIAAGDLEPTPYSAAAKGTWTWADSGAQFVNGLGFSVGSGADADLWIDNIALFGVDSSTFDSTKAASGISRKLASTKGILSAVRQDGVLRVSYAMPTAGRVEARLVDMQGRQISARTLSQSAGAHSLDLAMPNGEMAVLMLRAGDLKASQLILPVR